jgi:hypothetical protein
MVRLVDERQVQLRQVTDADLEPAVLACPPDEPIGDDPADAARPGARDDDLQFRHERNPLPG